MLLNVKELSPPSATYAVQTAHAINPDMIAACNSMGIPISRDWDERAPPHEPVVVDSPNCLRPEWVLCYGTTYHEWFDVDCSIMLKP